MHLVLATSTHDLSTTMSDLEGDLVHDQIVRYGSS